MICKGIVFEKDKLRILCMPHCGYRNPADPEDEKKIRQEEDEWNAMETLGRLVVHKWPETPPMWADSVAVASWQNYLMYLLKPVSRHYGVNDDAVLKLFVSHYMPSIMLSLKHKPTLQRRAKYTREQVAKMGLPEKEAQKMLRETIDDENV